jgi:hypothetical protein
VRAEKFRLTVARRRRFFTVFPCAESLVIVDGAVKFHARRLLQKNQWLPRKITRGRPLERISTSSGASNTSSSTSC